MGRKNGWQMAEELREVNAHGVQRLLAEADWDEEAVRDDLRAYVMEHLREEGGILVVDETGFIKKGKKSARVARQYSGTAGRRENCQVGVFLCMPADREAFIDPRCTFPRNGRRIGALPGSRHPRRGEVCHQGRTGPADVDAGLCGWRVGRLGGGGCGLRLRRAAAVSGGAAAELRGGGARDPHGLGPGQATAGRASRRAVAAGTWVVLSAGEGSKGPRLYEWAWLQLPAQTEGPNERARFILIRRSLADPSKRAYYRAAGPAQTTLAELVRVAGSRWKVEEGYEQAKGEVGLDEYEVRTWRAWYRYVTLALLAYAALVVMQGQAREEEKKVEQPSSGSH